MDLLRILVNLSESRNIRVISRPLFATRSDACSGSHTTMKERAEMNKKTIMIGVGLTIASLAPAQTTEVAPSVFRVESGVGFEMINAGASDFLFSWTDSSGSVVDEPDPTLILTAGEIYTFRRTTGSHPFVITDDSLPVSGTDGAYQRDTFDGAVIDAATLGPIADFTADPAPTKDFIEWSLTGQEIGDYFYTCRVTGHIGMVGRIEVVAGDVINPCPADLTGEGDLNFLDVSAFLSAFGNMDQAADFEEDGNFNFLDVSAFLAAFGDGCP